MATDPPPQLYKMALYRGDTRVFTHYINEDPPAWAASTSYVVGIVGTGPVEWAADSTVTFGADSKGVPIRYTCTTAHTSGTTFDAAMWTKDAKAVGEPIDITGWLFEATYRTTTEAPEDVAVDDCEIIDAPGGIMRRTLIAEQAALLPLPIVAWDLQATKPDSTVKTYLYNDNVKVTGDVTR